MVYENEINLIKVQNGKDGTGQKGEDGKTLYTWVKYSQYADGTDLTDDPTDAIYIGIAYNKEEQVESEIKTDYTWSKIKGEDGQDGASSYLWIRYATDESGADMTDVPSSTTTYIGTASTTTPTAPISASEYQWSKYVGSDGIPGKKGDDGKTAYLHIAYANSSDGSIDFDISDGTGKLYIGQYTDDISTDSTDPSKYTWTKIKGDDGQPGIGISKTTPLYYCSNLATVPNAPTTQVTINDAEKYNIWNLAVPTWTDTYQYYFVCYQVQYSDDTYGWSTPVADNSLTKAIATLIVHDEDIESKVSKTDYTGEQIASLINQTAESIKIIAKHIQLEGIITANGTFIIDENGYFHATGGSIGGFDINDGYLSAFHNDDDFEELTSMEMSATDGIRQFGYFKGTGKGYTTLHLHQDSHTDSLSGFKTKSSVLDFFKLSNADWNLRKTISIDGFTGRIEADSIQTTSGADLDSLNNKTSGFDKIEIIGQYTTNNNYGIWTSHTITLATITKVKFAMITTLANDPNNYHEVRITSYSGNQVNYQIKGGWSGGAAGVTVSCMAFE